jgi:hypothetical protein
MSDKNCENGALAGLSQNPSFKNSPFHYAIRGTTLIQRESFRKRPWNAFDEVGRYMSGCQEAFSSRQGMKAVNVSGELCRVRPGFEVGSTNAGNLARRLSKCVLAF